ncbi:hypothetical protein HA402_008073 [Bradysia odoriphaga]|nr:hypothetical protein HA402_008073 [Bradysia odoriphaga]
MPFSTDGIDSRYIDEDDRARNDWYRHYVIARKLYVRSEHPFPTVDYLQHRFAKYGSIESTEVLKSGREGYVTFSCDHNASLAYHREKRNGVDVAYPWHQPSTVTMNQSENEHDAIVYGEKEAPLLRLNDDCFFGLFHYLDNETLAHLSDTCTRLKFLLSDTYRFPKREFRLEGGASSRNKTSMPLATVRKIVRLMGSYFEVMHIDFTYMTETAVSKYLRIIRKYCKDNTRVRTLRYGASIWKDELDSLLVAFSGSLEQLDLCSLDITIGPDAIAICPKLKYLATRDVPKYTTTTHKPGIPTFPVINRQIRTFKSIFVSTSHFKTLAFRLPNVQKFSLILFDVLPNDFIHWMVLPLTKLKLEFDLVRRKFCDTLCEILATLHGLVSLVELKLYLSPSGMPMEPDDIHRSVMVLAQMLPHLKRVDLAGFTGINESTVLDFIGISKNLESFHLHRSYGFSAESFIPKLVSARQSRFQGKLNLYLDDDGNGPWGAPVDPYLNIQYNCSHSRSLRFLQQK